MRRSGKDVDDGAGFSLGSSSAEEVCGESSEALLARRGLSILAGKGLRPFAQRSSLGLRLEKGDEEKGSVDEKRELRPNPPLSGDVVRRLSMDECWRMILEHGMQWPVWNGPTRVQSIPELKIESDDPTIAVADGGLHLQGGQSDTQQREQDFVKQLAARALEALAAQSAPCRVPGPSMLAPKQTLERLDGNLAPQDALKAPRLPTPPTLHEHPTLLAKAPTLSRDMSTLTRPQSGELTIFYDGIVNVCNNVHVDKARLIMMYAEKAGLSAQARGHMQRPRLVHSSSAAPLQGIRASCDGPSQGVLHPNSKMSLPVRPVSSAPRGVSRSTSHVGGSTSEPANDENVHSAKQAAHGKSPMPVKVTVTTQLANPPLPVRQHVMLKPFPNARRKSLARFLDSRKRTRWTGASSEEVSPKRAALGEGRGPSDAKELQGNEKLESVQPSAPSKVGGASDPC